MGNINSAAARECPGSPVREGAISLDNLGGYYRPAILRKNELDTQTSWLGQGCLAQADRMENVFQLKGNGSSKEYMLMASGGPTQSTRKQQGFGNTISTPITPQRSRRARPVTAAGLLPSADTGPLSPTKSGHSYTARGGPALEVDLQSIPAYGPAARKRKAAAIAAARAAKQAEEHFKANHWRRNVDGAKRRLKLYLQAYMAWMSVLKKKRVGSYADSLPVDALPVILSNVLKELTNTAGEHLVACGGLVQGGDQAAAKLSALSGGRQWLAKAGCRTDATAPLGHLDSSSPFAKSETFHPLPAMLVPASAHAQPPHQHQHRPHSQSPSQPETVRKLMTMSAPANPFANAYPPAANPPPSPDRRRGARALATAGAGADALEQAGLAVKKALAIDMFAQDAGHEGASVHHHPQREADAVRRLTGLYMQNGANRTRISNAKDKEDIANMVKQEQVSLQVIANKANARWVEKHLTDTAQSMRGGWSPPVVLDSRTLQAGGVDMQLYSKSVGVLLSEGKVAVMMTYSGEEMPVAVDKHSNAELLQPAVQVDPWRAVQQLFPHKMPSSPYLSGLTLLDRRVLQVVLDCERCGGQPAVDRLTLVLAVDSQHTAWVADQALSKAHWSLQPHQVIIVAVARLPGMMWEPKSKTFKLHYSGAETYVSAGTGYAHLALAWPSHSFTMTQEGRAYIAGSALTLLASRGVEYLHATLLCDFEALAPGTPTLDPAFVGCALYAMDVHGANMAMQVVSSSIDAQARASNSIVLAPERGKMFSCSIPLSDVQSAATRPLVSAQTAAGNVVSCASRYLISVRHLKTIMTGPNAFHIKAQVHVPCMHIELDVSDLSSHPATRCVAVMGSAKGKGPAVRTQVLGREWLRDLVGCLVSQDGQPAMRLRLGRISDLAKACVPLPGNMPAAGNTSPITTVAPPVAGSGPGGSSMLLFVRDNAASRMAFKLALSFLGGRDVLHVLYVSSQEMSEADSRQLLASFSDVMSDAQINRKLVRQRERLVDTMVCEVETLQPDVVLLGSQALSKLQSAESIKPTKLSAQTSMGGGLSSTSVSMSLVKAVTDTPVLVVKTSSTGELLADSGVSAGCKKVVLEVSTASQEALKWLCPRLTPDRDKLLLVRPSGIDKATGKETPVSQRMTQAFATEAQSFRLNVKKMPMAESAGEGFAALVAREKCDVLTLIAPNARVTPPHILDLLRTARTSVLVWRQKSTAPIGSM